MPTARPDHDAMRTPACRLRLYRIDEATHMHRLIHGAMGELSRWLAWCTPDYGVDDAHRFIADAHWHAHQSLGPFEWAIVVDDVAVGSMGLHPVSLEPRVANLGYWMGTRHTGRGLATAAARQAVAWAFRHRAVTRIEIVAAHANTRSLRLAERLGARARPDARRRVTEHGRVVAGLLHVLTPADIADWPSQPAPDTGN